MEPSTDSCPFWIIGAACIVFSQFTPDELNLIKIFDSEALKLKDPDSKETVFQIDLDKKNPGSLTSHSAVFSNIPAKDGKATITMLLDPSFKDPEDRINIVKERYGAALYNLKKLDEKLKTEETLSKVFKESESINSLFSPDAIK